MKGHIFRIAMILSLALAMVVPAAAAPAGPAALQLPERLTATGVQPAGEKLDAALQAAVGPQRVAVRLTASPVASLFKLGVPKDAATRQQLRQIKNEQNVFIRAALRLDRNAQLLGTTARTGNVVMLEIDGAALNELAKLPNVVAIRQVRDYEIDLSETVPYIGGTAVNELGFTGEGVTVAVIDSGIDYIHAALGGSGDVAEYEANDPTIIEEGTFPTEKVIGGYDFVGGDWPNTPEAPDPDPLDAGPGGGHGTHVAHIIGGVAVEGTDIANGVAPDVSLYALKVCSSIATSCSGVALMQAMDWAVDPNGDGNFSDHVDVINMSLGSNYGQAFDDDLSAAVENATMLGVLTVASAGNGSDLPYVVGTPSAAITALSVAQTEVPSSFLQGIEVMAATPFTSFGTWQSWSGMLTEVIEAPIVFPNSTAAKAIACSDANGTNPYEPGELEGKIVLVNRGTCAISFKVANVKAAGGLAAIVGLVAAGDPTYFSYGGGDASIPGYNITLADANKIRAAINAGGGSVPGKLDPANQQSLKQHMVGSSSRGPAGWYVPWFENRTNLVKPEIGAPGGSLSAEYGTGTGQTPFSGTSGAAPMVAGAAALLVQAKPDFAPLEIKTLLVNNGETNIMNKAAAFGGDKAPIARIGGGEVRVDRALAAEALVYENLLPEGNPVLQEFFNQYSPINLPILSFGMWDIVKANQLGLNAGRNIIIENLTGADISYHLSSTFRFANDEASEAVTITFGVGIDTEMDVVVPANGAVRVKVNALVDPAKLPAWTFNSGAQGANPDLLTKLEYDGIIWLDNTATADDDAAMLHMPWHILPRAAGNIQATEAQTVQNTGASPANVDIFELLGESPSMGRQTWASWGDSVGQIDIAAVGAGNWDATGVCDAGFGITFNVSTYDRIIHGIVPAEFDLYIDTTGDGVADYVVFNWDIGLPNSSLTGRAVTWVADLSTGTTDAWFYIDHPTNSPNIEMIVCGEQLGLGPDDTATVLGIDAYAFDMYSSGNLTDAIEGMTFTAGLDGAPYGFVVVNPGESVELGSGLLLNNMALGPNGYSGAPIGSEWTILP